MGKGKEKKEKKNKKSGTNREIIENEKS